MLSAEGIAAAQCISLVHVATYALTLRLSELAHLTYPWVIAAAAGAFLVLSAAERWLRRRAGGRSARPRVLGALSLTAAGLALAVTLLLLVAAAYGALTGILLTALGYNPVGPDFMARRFGVALVTASVILVALARGPSALARRLMMRQLRTQAESDLRATCLLLRSFNDDSLRLRSRRVDRAGLIERMCMRRRERFEEVLVSALSRYDAVEALGEPGQHMPPALGAVRRQFSHEFWQQGVQALVQSSRLVAVTLGRTDSLMWEIGQIRAMGALHKTVFVVPPVASGEAALRLRALAEALGAPWEALAPPAHSTVLAVVCPAWWGGHPVLVTAAAPDDVSYDAALETCSALLDPSHEPRPRVRAAIEAATARQGATRSGTPEPPLAVWQPGKAPRRKAWWRRPWIPFLLSPAVTMVMAFPFAQDVSKEDVLRLADGYTVTSVAQDTASDALYAVINSRDLVRLDLAKRDVQRIAHREQMITDLAVVGGVAYLGASVPGTVEAVALPLGTTRWMASSGGAFRGFTVTEGAVYVVVPSARAVERYDPSSGRRTARTEVSGVPWDLAVAGSGLRVALEDVASVAELDAVSLAVRATVRALPDTQRVVGAAGRSWVYSPILHVMAVLPDGGGGANRAADGTRSGTGSRPSAQLPSAKQPQVLTVENRWTTIRAGGGRVGVIGFERVTLIEADGTLRRIPLLFSPVRDLCIEHDGSVVVVGDSEVARLT